VARNKERLDERETQMLELREAPVCAEEELQAARQVDRQLVKERNTDRGPRPEKPAWGRGGA
jgi:hypothetical protein